MLPLTVTTCRLLALAAALALGTAAAIYLARPKAPAPAKPAPSALLETPLTPPSPVNVPKVTSPNPAAPPPPLPADLAPLQEKTTYRADTAATEVFRRAFWREPAPADRILQAERREWVGERDGVRRWQWFIILDPGPDLAAWLREKNPFGLAPAAPADLRLDAASQPAWFPAEVAALPEVDCFQSSDGAMVLLREKAGGRLYVSDRGHGFAAAPPPSVPVSNGPGLIPGREQPLRIPGDVRRENP